MSRTSIIATRIEAMFTEEGPVGDDIARLVEPDMPPRMVGLFSQVRRYANLGVWRFQVPVLAVRLLVPAA